MWSSTVGLINGKHKYLTAETFGFKINSNGQVLKKRQQWTIEPFHENSSRAAELLISPSVSSNGQIQDTFDPYIFTISSDPICQSLNSVRSSSNGSASSEMDTCSEEHENVAIKSHLNKYLAVDSFGNVTCDSDEKTENTRFTITICSMSQGKSIDEQIFWAFKNVERGYYLGSTENGDVCCNAKMPKSRADLWLLHLIPARGASFFALRSLGRKRYARVVDIDSNSSTKKLTQVQLDATNSWGSDTLFQFKFHDGGRYSLLTTDNRYLTNEGHCVKFDSLEDSLPPRECLFTIEYHSGFLAFRDTSSQYLAATGRTSLIKSRSTGVSRDELFVFEPASIQVSLKATFNNRWVSIKQSCDLSANQTETSPITETFQLTYHQQTGNWTIMTYDCCFWTAPKSTNTISIAKLESYDALNHGQFRFIWSESEATCSLKFVDLNQQERWVAARKSGQLCLASGSQTPVKFIMRFQNRKILNLRPVNGCGFVGLKPGTNSRQLEANKTSPDPLIIEYSELLSSNVLSNELPLGGKINNCNGKMTLPQQEFSEPCQNWRLELIGAESKPFSENGDDLLDTIHHKSISSSDDNNNNCELEEDRMKEEKVELNPTPSVASIISSFTKMRTSKSSITERKRAPVIQLSTSRVSKLASSFNNNQKHINGNNELQTHANSDVMSDTASVLTSSSGGTSSPSVTSNQADGLDAGIAMGANLSASERLAQFECCYLKLMSNNRYLIVGESDSSVICDAVNRACAQPWVLELRSHNALAIRASDDHAYLQLGANGTIFLSRCEAVDASLWEF